MFIWKLIYILQWLVLCVNLVGLWSPIVHSNRTWDATVKDFSDVMSTYHQQILRLLPLLWVGLIHLFESFRSKCWDFLKKRKNSASRLQQRNPTRVSSLIACLKDSRLKLTPSTLTLLSSLQACPASFTLASPHYYMSK